MSDTRDRPRLAYVAHALNPGGTERLVVDMAIAFASRFHVAVFCLDEPGAWAATLRAAGIPVHGLWRQPGLDLSMAGRLATHLRAFGAEVAPHLALFGRTPDRHGQITLLLLALLSRPTGGRPFFEATALEKHYPRAGQNLARLVRLGYVAESGGRYALFSRAFADWIAAEMATGSPSPAGEAAREPAPADLSRLPADRRKALAAALDSVAPGYRSMLFDLFEQTGDPSQTLKLLRQTQD